MTDISWTIARDDGPPITRADIEQLARADAELEVRDAAVLPDGSELMTGPFLMWFGHPLLQTPVWFRLTTRGLEFSVTDLATVDEALIIASRLDATLHDDDGNAHGDNPIRRTHRPD